MPVPGQVTDTSRVSGSEITLTRGGQAIGAYLARPASGAPKGGIIIIHEAFGLNEHIRDLARRFANLGYIAIAPDLYARSGAPKQGDMADLFAKMLAIPDSQSVADLEAANERLRAEGARRIGVIGFCSGGRQTLLYACSSGLVDAAVDCWGGFISRADPNAETTPNRPRKVLDMVSDLACPLMGAFGETDDNPPMEDVEELGRRLLAAGKEHDIRIYPGVGHAFLADYRPSYDEAQAHVLWKDLTAFFAKHLAN